MTKKKAKAKKKQPAPTVHVSVRSVTNRPIVGIDGQQHNNGDVFDLDARSASSLIELGKCELASGATSDSPSE